MKCLDIVSKASVKISEGEVKQLIHINNLNKPKADYLDIIIHKTAQLFSAAREISAEIMRSMNEERKMHWLILVNI